MLKSAYEIGVSNSMKRLIWLLPLLLAIALLCSCAANVSQESSLAPSLTPATPLAAEPDTVSSLTPGSQVSPPDPQTANAGATEPDIAPSSPPAVQAANAGDTEPDTAPPIPPEAPVSDPDAATLQVIVLDVGQADCILLKTEAHTMLIDAGNKGQDKLILDYLASYGVAKLDYLVATHPHADHIGAMAAVIRTMEGIGEVLLPQTGHTTKTYEAVLKAIAEKNIPMTNAKPGDLFALGKAQIQVVAPNSAAYSNLNDYSVVLLLEFGKTTFLFTGDADVKSENEQLANGLTLKADVLKVGHHGSRTSSAQKYLNAASPTYAVISCGQGNTYGHPHSEAMKRLNGMNVEIYRTDENGTVVFNTDGENITVKAAREPGTTPQPIITEQNATQTTVITPLNPYSSPYIGNKNSKTFHLATCRSLPQEQNRFYFETYDEAIDTGYTPCSSCKPVI